MRTITLSVCLACVLIVLGCTHTYHIQMTPRGDSIERRLSSFKDAEKQQLIGVYGQPPSGDPATFSAWFNESTPDDIGASGKHLVFETRMGSLSAYMERFRGTDDIVGHVQQIVKTSDRAVDVLLGWFGSELGGDPRWTQLRQFIDGPLRRDLKQLASIYWISNTSDADGWSHWRAIQFMIERGYIEAKQAPQIARLFSEGFESNDTEAQRQLMTFFQRFVAQRMGVPDDQPVPQSLAFLSLPDRADESFKKWYHATDQYRQRLAQWQRENADNPDADVRETDYPDDINIATVAHLELFGSATLVDLQLEAPVEPLQTNGRWSAAEKAIKWNKPIGDDRALAAFCFAFWVEPNHAFQAEHFGKTLLGGEQLAEYVMWRRSLKEQEAAEWDRLIDSVQPTDDLSARLRDFRFSGESGTPDDSGEMPASYAQTAIDLLVPKKDEN